MQAGVVWDSREAAWNDGLEHFLAIKPDAEGKRRVTQRFASADGFRLGKWADCQRQAFKKGVLTPERSAILQAAGMLWDPGEGTWEEALLHFQEFEADELGRRMVPQNYVTAGGFKLGWWQQVQRRGYHADPPQLSEQRIARLEAAGIVWDPKKASWEEGLAIFELVPRNANGLRLVPQNHVTDDGFRLGLWVSTQRSTYRGGRMIRERIERLEAAGMVWSMQTTGNVGAPPKRKLTCTPRSRGAAAKIEYGRGLQAAGGVAAQEDEAAWHEEWRQRLSCWWLALPRPMQADLGHCLGALSLHLTARINALVGKSAPHAASTMAGAEPGCEWLMASPEELQLPDFPMLGGLEFSLPPIPMLLPSWEQLRMHSHGDVHHKEREPAASTMSPLAIGSSGILAFAVSASIVLLLTRRDSKPRCL